MWQDNRPEVLRELSLRVLLHRAWLERKKSFDNVVEFLRYNPFRAKKINFGTLAREVAVVKAGTQGCPIQCAKCSIQGNSAPQVLTGSSTLQEVRENLSHGQCSGVISLTDDHEKEFMEALSRLNNSCRVSVIGSSVDLLHHDFDELASRLNAFNQSGIEVSLLILVTGEFEQDYAALTKLADLRLPVLTVLFKFTGGETNVFKSIEQSGKLVAIARILNPETQLGFACLGACRYQTSLLEQYALNAGFNEISCPSAETISLAKDMGLTPVFKENCCLIKRLPTANQ